MTLVYGTASHPISKPTRSDKQGESTLPHYAQKIALSKSPEPLQGTHVVVTFTVVNSKLETHLPAGAGRARGDQAEVATPVRGFGILPKD